MSKRSIITVCGVLLLAFGIYRAVQTQAPNRLTQFEQQQRTFLAEPFKGITSDGNVTPLAKDGYAITMHRFEKPGTYLVSVSRTNGRGATATARLKVIVE